jgi:hypothetical protein
VVKPIPCGDPSAALQCIELKKSDGTRYHVSQHAHGSECTCPDWVFSRDGIDPAGCKHIRALEAFGLVVADVRPVSGGSPDSAAQLERAGGAHREPAESWPDWTDSDRWELGADACGGPDHDHDRDDAPEDDPDWDRWASVSEAVSRLERGLDASHDHSGQLRWASRLGVSRSV